MSWDRFIYTLASVAVVSSYPIFRQQGRFEPQEINFPPEFAIWPRQEPAPMYGYPDFGDYADPRPAYSELDIVREQLAHPQIPPFIKRFPANIPYPYGEPIPLDDEEEQNWGENEVSINKPALEMLTEALMETLVRKSESDSNLPPPEDVDLESDLVVQELKQTAAKKSLPPQPTVKTFEKFQDKTPKGSGQQEIALLRPPSHSPIFSAKPTGDGKAAPVTTQQDSKMLGGYVKRRQTFPYVSTGDDLTKELSKLKKIVQ